MAIGIERIGQRGIPRVSCECWLISVGFDCLLEVSHKRASRTEDFELMPITASQQLVSVFSGADHCTTRERARRAVDIEFSITNKCTALGY